MALAPGALTVKVPRHQLRLNGIRYGTPDKPAIYLSSNEASPLIYRRSTIHQDGYLPVHCSVRAVGDVSSVLGCYEAVSPPVQCLVLCAGDGRVRFVQKDMTIGSIEDRG